MANYCGSAIGAVTRGCSWKWVSRFILLASKSQSSTKCIGVYAQHSPLQRTCGACARPNQSSIGL